MNIRPECQTKLPILRGIILRKDQNRESLVGTGRDLSLQYCYCFIIKMRSIFPLSASATLYTYLLQGLRLR